LADSAQQGPDPFQLPLTRLQISQSVFEASLQFGVTTSFAHQRPQSKQFQAVATTLSLKILSNGA
jgi:hypothetical protein